MDKKTTTELLNVLKNTPPSAIDDCLKKYKESFVGEREFTEYMRSLFRKKNIVQQDMFRAAGIPEKYGYRMISGEKKTRQRDTILRICIASGFSLKETQTALELYGMPELYARASRDAVFIIAINSKIHDIEKIDEMLISHEMEPLKHCGNDEW